MGQIIMEIVLMSYNGDLKGHLTLIVLANDPNPDVHIDIP